MDTERLFEWALVEHTTKFRAEHIGRNYRELVETKCRKEVEGLCGPDGFVRPGTVSVVSYQPGEIVDIDFGRSYLFRVTLRMQVCNPLPGLRFPGIVQSANKIGIMVEGGYFDEAGTLVPVLEVVIVRETMLVQNEVPLDDLQPGDEVKVEILGRVYELNDLRIRAFGRTVVELCDPIQTKQGTKGTSASGETRRRRNAQDGGTGFGSPRAETGPSRPLSFVGDTDDDDDDDDDDEVDADADVDVDVDADDDEEEGEETELSDDGVGVDDDEDGDEGDD